MKNPWSIAVSAKTTPPLYVVFKGGASLNYEQALDVQKRANAYPKLVEALDNIIYAPNENEQHKHEANARALLCELGEAK
jgi:hypothetical protein